MQEVFTVQGPAYGLRSINRIGGFRAIKCAKQSTRNLVRSLDIIKNISQKYQLHRHQHHRNINYTTNVLISDFCTLSNVNKILSREV